MGDLSPWAALATPWVPSRGAVTCRGEQRVLQGVGLQEALPPAAAGRGAELLAVPPSTLASLSVPFLCGMSLPGDRELPALHTMHQPEEDDYR